MYWPIILLTPFSRVVMSSVDLRKAFSESALSVARALSEPSYLLRNCRAPVYGVGAASQRKLPSPVLSFSIPS
ncbi:hypothetical protein D3C71_1668480 [compost metagenome]